jgi:hypothetical protein
LFTYLLAICTSFVQIVRSEFSFENLSTYSVDYWFFLGLVFWAPCIFWLLISCQMYSWQRFFSHSVGSLVKWLFPLLCRSFFSFMQSHLTILSLNSEVLEF